MSRPEVEDLAQTARVRAATAEDLAALEPADHDQLVRRRNIEQLTVHLFALDIDVLRQTLRDRVTRIDDPDSLVVVRLPPLQ